MVLHLLVLVAGVFCCSTAVLMIKACNIDPVLLSALRLLVAAMALLPLFLRDWRRHRSAYGLRELRASLLPGLVLGVHFISWIIGARMTTAANATLIVNLVAVVMPFLLFLFLRERPTRWELVGTVLAIAGMFLLTYSDLSLSRTHFWGDLLCFGSMLLFAVYLVIARMNRALPTVWLYIVPLYWVAGIFCLILALPVLPSQSFSPLDWLMVLGLGIVPTVIGHSLLNISMQRLRGQVVSVVNMGQFVFAGVLAYLLFREVPQPSFYASSLLLVAGGLIAVRGVPRQ